MWRATGVSGGARACDRTAAALQTPLACASCGRIAGPTAGTSEIEVSTLGPDDGRLEELLALAGQQQLDSARPACLQQSGVAVLSAVHASTPRAHTLTPVNATRIASAAIARRLGMFPSVADAPRRVKGRYPGVARRLAGRSAALHEAFTRYRGSGALYRSRAVLRDPTARH